MSKLLQISDPHFGTERPPVVAALLDLARREQADIQVLSGDITQRATAAEFAAAQAFIAALPAAERLLIPGNHDIPLYDFATRALAPYRRYREGLAAPLEAEIETEAMLVIGVNTTRWWRHKHGVISRAQTARVAERLARARETQLRIVVAHHPFAAMSEREERHVCRGAGTALRVWRAAGLDLMLGGHIHLPYVLPLHGDVGRSAWCVQAGTAVSRRTRAGVPNSVNLIRYAPGARQCEAERWDFSAANQRFERQACAPLALSR